MELWSAFVDALVALLIALTQASGGQLGLGIIAFTVLVRIVMAPLAWAQLRSARANKDALRELQPDLEALKRRYAKDPRRLQAEMLKLQRERGINPALGCALSLAQLPVGIGLWYALRQGISRLAKSARFLWIPDLSRPDPWLILPLLAGLTTWLLQRLSPGNPEAQAQTGALLQIVLPLLVTLMAWKLAAGLSLYWATGNLFDLGLRYAFARMYPQPTGERRSSQARRRSRSLSSRRRR